MKIAIDINDVIRAFSSKFASCYKKGIDPTYDIDNVEFTSNRLYEVFPFKDEQSYNDFVYVDYPYELFGAAEPVDKNLPARLNDWLANDLTEMDIDEIPTVILVSPYEYGLTIQSTHYFLSKTGSRVRCVYFPLNSSDVWNECDILITANPKLLDEKPSDKVAIKIIMPYNKDSKSDYEFDKLMDLINDENNTIEKILKDGK